MLSAHYTLVKGYLAKDDISQISLLILACRMTLAYQLIPFNFT